MPTFTLRAAGPIYLMVPKELVKFAKLPAWHEGLGTRNRSVPFHKLRERTIR